MSSHRVLRCIFLVRAGVRDLRLAFLCWLAVRWRYSGESGGHDAIKPAARILYLFPLNAE